MKRPPWDGSIFDAALLNTGRASYTKTYFSVPEKLKESSRSRNSSAGSTGSTVGRRGGRRGGGRGGVRCPCCGRLNDEGLTGSKGTRDELRSSLLRDWTEPSRVRSARQQLDDGPSPPSPKSLAAALDAAAVPTPPVAPPVAPPPPPAPEVSKAAKGKGKGKAPPPPRPAAKSPAAPPSAAAKRSAGKRPFARWLDWRSFNADRVADTVFQGLWEAGAELVNLGQLERHFGHRLEFRALPTAPMVAKEVEILSQRRAQNMLIAFRRQPPSAELLKALQDFEFAWLSTETLEVLVAAMPTPEEEKQLLNYSGDITELRDLEQDLLPFASLVPSAASRLHLALLQRDLTERANLARRRLNAVAQGAQRICHSGALRQLLRHVLLLGNALNGGETPAMGFSIEVLPRLALSKATSDPRMTLLHLLVAQMLTADPQLPQQLLDDLSHLGVVASLPLPQLAQELRLFAQDVQTAKAVLRRAFPGFDSPQQFFIGDDGEEDADRAAMSNSCIAQHFLREVYLRIAQAPPEPLKQMATAAAENAEQLQVDLAEARDQVATMLAFFAFSTASADGANVDAKSEDFFLLLKRFLSDFEQCVQDLPQLDLTVSVPEMQ